MNPELISQSIKEIEDWRAKGFFLPGQYCGLNIYTLLDAYKENEQQLSQLRADYKQALETIKQVSLDYNHPWPNEDSSTWNHRIEMSQQMDGCLLKPSAIAAMKGDKV